MRQIAPEPLGAAAARHGSAASPLLRHTGAARRGLRRGAGPGPLARTAARRAIRVVLPLVPAPRVDAMDPTGCGDVFGATLFAACWPVTRPRWRSARPTGSPRATSPFAAPPAWQHYLSGALVTRMTRLVEIPASLRRPQLRAVRRLACGRRSGRRPGCWSTPTRPVGVALWPGGAAHCGPGAGRRPAANGRSSRCRRRMTWPATGPGPASSTMPPSCSRSTARCRR